MGGARYMRGDLGTIYTKKEMALGFFFLWVFGGLVFCVTTAMIFLSKPTFSIPFIFYFLGIIILFKRYLNTKDGK